MRKRENEKIFEGRGALTPRVRDCHIESDWVLLYVIRDDVLVLTLTDTGTHSDLGL